ncbi:MAG: hypothetical protein ABUT20_02440 [Bacteroidota bacterium]
MSERDSLLLLAVQNKLQHYRDAVDRDQPFHIKKTRWLELKEALADLEKVSMPLKEKFIADNHLPQHHSNE